MFTCMDGSPSSKHDAPVDSSVKPVPSERLLGALTFTGVISTRGSRSDSGARIVGLGAGKCMHARKDVLYIFYVLYIFLRKLNSLNLLQTRTERPPPTEQGPPGDARNHSWLVVGPLGIASVLQKSRQTVLEPIPGNPDPNY